MRHVWSGWVADVRAQRVAYPRYYLPIAAIVPLAGVSFFAAIGDSRWRVTLLIFLVGGPMLFWASARRSASRRPVERGPTENTR
jgi:hypothetical protein